MFGLGGQELLIILLVALIVLGPQKLPDIARTMGKAMGEFNKAKMDLKREINRASEMEADEAVRAAARDDAEKEAGAEVASKMSTDSDSSGDQKEA